MKKYLFIILLCIGLVSCGGPEPRKPIKVKSGNFYKASAERNKSLLAKEEAYIQKLIAMDSANTYQNSASGSWYHYTQKNKTTDYVPQTDDLVTMTYAVLSLENDTIYSFEDIGIVKYKVDKQELFPGLRNSVKLLKEGETATFLYPSSLAFGYHGDGKKIGTNIPIKSTIKIFKIDKDSVNVQKLN
ncbi:gliding motility-associated peptidyl-prolyl isomerase GldI [Costertonia aggregata]|uniref:Peptidyl-prolyl cis-trans isomerase n=1 Tax=Costertonia aggregata TaxID=343403 RepID=A0A7H9AKV8_9FLAO|nr:gliding motility-associated peptidyl-prolyl isomerase GldI [Costertonia aggregata]QLG44099.1 gliding motility-associated peptidyl-prolyl isomerase GldI [Costertonia aggregata]